MKTNEEVVFMLAGYPMSGKISRITKRSVEIILNTIYYSKVTIRRVDLKEAVKAAKYWKDYA